MKGVTLPTETVFVMEASPIKFGLGATDEIAYDVRRLGLKRVLIVTDRHISELGLPDRIRLLLEEEGIKADVYDGVEIEPTDRSMEEAAEYARQRELDGLIAVGGGRLVDQVQGGDAPGDSPGALAELHHPAGRPGSPGAGSAQAADRRPDDGGNRQRDDGGGGYPRPRAPRGGRGLGPSPGP